MSLEDEHINLSILLSMPDELSLRNLDELSNELHFYLTEKLKNDEAKPYKRRSSRSLDPAIVGAVSLALLPVVLQKVADVLIEFIKLKQNTIVTLKIPIEGSEDIQITYDPRTSSPEQLRTWAATAINTVSKNTVKRKKKA
ncbi:MAG: hypothetical protein WCK35_08760 [Chloroflexota bacterium]